MKMISKNANEKIALLEMLRSALNHADALKEPMVAVHINSAIEALKNDSEGS